MNRGDYVEFPECQASCEPLAAMERERDIWARAAEILASTDGRTEIYASLRLSGDLPYTDAVTAAAYAIAEAEMEEANG